MSADLFLELVVLDGGVERVLLGGFVELVGGVGVWEELGGFLFAHVAGCSHF